MLSVLYMFIKENCFYQMSPAEKNKCNVKENVYFFLITYVSYSLQLLIRKTLKTSFLQTIFIYIKCFLLYLIR